MQKSFTLKAAEVLCWLGGGVLFGMGLGAILTHHYGDSLPYLLIGGIGLYYGRGWVFPEV